MSFCTLLAKICNCGLFIIIRCNFILLILIKYVLKLASLENSNTDYNFGKVKGIFLLLTVTGFKSGCHHLRACQSKRPRNNFKELLFDSYPCNPAFYVSLSVSALRLYSCLPHVCMPQLTGLQIENLD